MKFTRVYSVAAIASCAAGLIAAPASLATDNSASNAKNQLAITKQKQAERYNPYQNLRTAPAALPYMPLVTPPSGKFLMGIKDATQKGKIVLILRFGILNPPADMLKYYADSMRNARWSVKRATADTVMATYKSYTCALSAYPSSHKGYPHDIVINYQMPAGGE